MTAASTQNDFAHALQIVEQSLTQLRDSGAQNRIPLSASSESLAQLAQAANRHRAAQKTERPTQLVANREPASPKPQMAETAVSEKGHPSHHPLAHSPAPALSSPPLAKLDLTADEKIARIDEIRARVLDPAQCPPLETTRDQVVFSVGNPNAQIVFVGEAPGADEEEQREPFVGKAGQLLTKIITAMGFTREDVYIANVMKYRPAIDGKESGNRPPTAAEMAVYLPILLEELTIIQPRVVVALGATAMAGLVGNQLPMSRVRGRWHDFYGIPLMATYHPAYLLRNQSISEKRKVWEDMLLVLEKLDLAISEKQRGYFLSKS